MKVHLGSPARREELHQYIREAAREIEEDTPLLRALFTLENGTEKRGSSGFGWANKNTPQESVVRFKQMTVDELAEIRSQLEEATAADLGDPDDDQLTVLAENLTEVADALQRETQ